MRIGLEAKNGTKSGKNLSGILFGLGSGLILSFLLLSFYGFSYVVTFFNLGLSF